MGKYNFGFMWAAVACLFLSTVFLCGGGAAGGKKEKRGGGRGGGGGRFGGRRNKSQKRDRGSFYNDRSSFESE